MKQHTATFKFPGECCTTQKMNFSIKDFFSKCDRSAGNCVFGHMY